MLHFRCWLDPNTDIDEAATLGSGTHKKEASAHVGIASNPQNTSRHSMMTSGVELAILGLLAAAWSGMKKQLGSLALNPPGTRHDSDSLQGSRANRGRMRR